jgi:hypothetical protein
MQKCVNLHDLGGKYSPKNYFQLHVEGECSAVNKLATELRDKTNYSGSASRGYKYRTETLQQLELRSLGQLIALEFQEMSALFSI